MSLILLLIVCQIPGYLLQTILLATQSGINEITYTHDVWITSSVVHMGDGASTIDFHDKRGEVYFSSGKKIFRSKYNHPVTKPSTPELILDVTFPPNDIVVDWDDNKIHWSSVNAAGIQKANLDGTDSAEDVSTGTGVSSLSLDPANGMFYVRNVEGENRLGAYPLQDPDSDSLLLSNSTKHLMYFAYDNVQIVKFAITCEKHDVCRLLYNIPERTLMLHEGPELSGPFSFDVFNNEVVWGTFNNGTYTVYWADLAHPAPHNKLNLTLIYNSTQKVEDVKIYHSQRKTGDSPKMCEGNTCSYDCYVASPTKAMCYCEDGKYLSSDGISCTGTTINVQSTPLKTSTAIPDHQVTSATQIVQSTPFKASTASTPFKASTANPNPQEVSTIHNLQTTTAAAAANLNHKAISMLAVVGLTLLVINNLQM